MDYQKLRLIFNLMKDFLDVQAEIVDDTDPKLFQFLKNDTEVDENLGIAYNLCNASSSVISMDLFESESLRKGLKEIRSKKVFSLPDEHWQTIRGGPPMVFINLDAVKKYHANSNCKGYFRREVPGWYEYPLSLRTLCASIIVHELVHCKLDNDRYAGCPKCLECKHCDHFYSVMRDSWNRILQADCLRRIDFALAGVNMDELIPERIDSNG